MMTETPIVFFNHGQQLVGVLHRPDAVSTPRPAVVFFHGFTGTKVEPHRIFVKAARQLAAAGIFAFRFDFRGSGDSEGDFSEMTISGEISDALKAIDVLTTTAGVDPNRIGALGLSMGGGVAACVCGRDPRIKSAVLWAPLSDDPPDVLQMMLGANAARPNPGADFVDFWGGNTVGPAFFADIPRIKPSQEIQRFSGPLLIVHGTADETVPATHGRRYYELMRNRNAPTEIEMIPDADHTFNTKAWEDRVIARSVEWFRKTL
jgi:hypothetical protein